MPATGGFLIGAVGMQLADIFLRGYTDVAAVVGAESQEMVETEVVRGGAPSGDVRRRKGGASKDTPVKKNATAAADSRRRVLLLVAAITIHNFPEGLAVGVGFGGVGKGGQTFEKVTFPAVD